MFGFWKKIFGKGSKSPREQFRDAYASPFEEKRKAVEMEKAGEVILDQYRPEEHLPDSVTEAEIVKEKPKRSRTKKGTYKADDKATPDVNEAYVGGKAPKKKVVKITRKKAKKK